MAFPVKLTSRPKSIQEVYDFEGVSATITRQLYGSFTGTSLSLGASSTLQGKALLTKAVSITATEQIQVQFLVGGYSGNLLYPQFNSGGGSHWISPGPGLSIPFEETLRANQVGIVTLVNKAIKFGVSPSASTPIIFDGYINVHGRYITDDFNWDADYIVNVIGDSIAWGSGITNNPDMWVFKVRDYFLSNQRNVRLRNWSISGSTLTQHMDAFQAGIYSYREPGITLIPLGQNDSISAVSTATSIAALANILLYAGYYFPNHNLVVVPPSPNGDATIEARNVTLRAAMLSYVAGLNKSNITCVNGMGACLNTSTDLQADKTHPLASGQLGIYNCIKAHLDIPANNLFSFIS